MINIYLNHFLLNGQMQNGWMFVETIPMPQGTTPIFTSIKVKTEMGKSETADITLDPNSPYWNSFVPYKTFIRVEVDSYTIFYGRVLTGSTTMWGNKTFQCEGPLSFMVDTYYPASKESGRAKISTLEYLTKVLDGHNYYVDYDDRSIYIGEVPGNYTSATSTAQRVETESQKFGVTSWTETKSAVEELRSYYGGYMRTRFNSSDGKLYLDWLNHYFDSNLNPQQIKLGRNLIDFNTNTEVSNIFTAIIPLGKNETTIEGYRNDVHGNGKWLSVPAICNIYTDAQLNQGYHKAEDYHDAITKHGWIYKTVSFPNASTKEELFNQACLWVKNNFQPEVENYTIKALDMRILGESGKPLLSGDRVTFSYSAGNSTLQPTVYTVISAEYDLYNPENNSYRIGIPANLLTKMFSVNSSGKSTSGGPGGYSPPEDENAGETEGYTDWLNKIIGFLLSHKVPNTNSYYLTPSGGRYRIYNAITGSFDTIDEVTYDAISSRGLLSYIGNNDPDKDEWNGIIFGKDSENTPAWVDYIKSFLIEKGLYNEQNSTMYNAHSGMMVPISSFSIALVESFGLFDYVKDRYGVDLRNIKIEEDVETEVGGGTSKTWLGKFTTKIRDTLNGTIVSAKSKFMEIQDGLLKFFDKDGDGITDIAVQGDDGKDISLRSLQTNWVNTDTRIGAVVTDDGKVNVGEIVLAINEDNSVDAIIHADRVKATGNDGAMFGIVTAEGTDNEKLDAGLIVSKIENDEGSLETLTELIGQNIEIKGKNIKIDARDYASLGIVTTGLTWTDSKGVQHPVTSNVTAGLIVEAMNDGSMTESQKQVIATLIADKVRIKGKNVDIAATEFAQLGIVTNGLVDEKGNPVDSELTAGLIVRKMQSDTGEQETLAKLIADYIEITGKNIKVSASEYAQLGIVTNENLSAGLIVEKITNDSGSQSTLASLIGDKVSIRASQMADFGVEAQNEAGKLVTAKFIADTLNGGTATINAKNLNLSSTEVINLINSTGNVTINAAKVNLNGYLQTSQLATEFGKITSVSAQHISASGSVTSSSFMRATDFQYGNNESLLNAYTSATVATSGSTITITLNRANAKNKTELSFNKAATISGSWASGVFTVKATSGSTNTVITSLANTGHWGVASNGEDVNKYYYKTYATIGTSGTVYDTGNATVIDATARYNAGWTDSFSVITLSQTSVSPLNPGGSVTIYPKAQATPSTSAQNITSKGLTITARALAASDITMGAFTQVSNTGGYSFVGTATPAAEDTYWHFKVSNLKDYYVKVNRFDPSVVEPTISGWRNATANDGIREIGTCALGTATLGYWAFTINDSYTYRVKATATHSSSTISISGWTTASANDGISEIGTCALGTNTSGYWKFTVNNTNTYRVKATATQSSGGGYTGITYNKSTHKVSASTSSTTTSYTITASTAAVEWDTTNKRFNVTSEAKIGNDVMASDTSKSTGSLDIDVTSSTTQVYLKTGNATLITKSHLAAGWTQYYDSGWWHVATADNGWEATIPNREGTAAKDWDCGAKDAYAAGINTCFMGNANSNDITGTTQTVKWGETLQVWIGAKNVSGTTIWPDGKWVKCKASAPAGSPWIGGEDSKPLSAINVGYNETKDIWPAITAEDGAVGWGTKITVSGPTEAVQWGKVKATRSTGASGTQTEGNISYSLLRAGQYINLEVHANGKYKYYYIAVT